MDTQKFKLQLLNGLIDNKFINTGEKLWISLKWQNIGTVPADQNYTFVLYIEYGHQRKLENQQRDFIVHTKALVPTTRWTSGTICKTVFQWECLTDWAGTYHLSVGIVDEDGMPVSFGAAEDSCTRAAIGQVDVGWGYGEPTLDQINGEQSIRFAAPADIRPAVRPSDRLILKDAVTVELAGNTPEIYAVSDSGSRFEMKYARPVATIRNKCTGEELSEGSKGVTVEYQPEAKNEKQVQYPAECRIDGKAVLNYVIHYELNGRVLSVYADGASEDLYELVDVRYPSFAEVSDGCLVDFFGSGRLVPSDTAYPVTFEKTYDIRNAAALYDDQGMLVIESGHIDSKLMTGVLNMNGENRAVCGGTLVNKIPGNKGIKSIPISKPVTFTIELADLDGAAPSWQKAAELLRRGLKRNPYFEMYRNCYFYKQLVTMGPLPDQSYDTFNATELTKKLFKTTTFDEVTAIAEKFGNLTDHVKQVLYVAGWQKGGFDTAYPLPYGVEERCGGIDGLRKCLNDLRADGILSGLHDNFDDVCNDLAQTYPYTARDESGKPWMGWIWPGGPTYINAIANYTRSGEAKKRIEHMKEMLPLKDTYHLDVLTAETCRYDYNEDAPASAQDSYEAKMKVVDLFREQGLDITSEILAHPAVGHIGFALHNRLDETEVFIPGDTFIPLVPMIYHGTIGYCSPSTTETDLLWALLVGGQLFCEEELLEADCVTRYYLQHIPAMCSYGKKMLDFNFDGHIAEAVYEHDSKVTVDFDNDTYTVVYDGQLIGKDHTTFAPATDPQNYLAFSKAGGQLVYPCPEVLKNTALKAVILTRDGVGDEVGVQVKGDQIILDMPKQQPVKVIKKEL